MKINEVKTCFKICNVKLIENSDKLNFEYLNEIVDENGNKLENNILHKNVPRVYIICSNGVIKKIGGSEAKGGMMHTLSIYKDGGLMGQPSLRSIGTWWHMYHELLVNKSNIEIYMIYQDEFNYNVKGLFKKTLKKLSISYKHIENECLADYFSVENKYPDWNYKENDEVWPSEVDALEKICKQNKNKSFAEGKILDFHAELKRMGFTNTKIIRSKQTNKRKS